MRISLNIEIDGIEYQASVDRPIDISITLQDGLKNPNCFYAPPVEFSPLVSGDFNGSIQKGSPVNFYNVKMNPHGNGTHTECIGHISSEFQSLNKCLKKFLFPARLVSVYPEKKQNGDRVIGVAQFEDIQTTEVEALIIRTMPNDPSKETMNWSGSNPPFVDEAAIRHLVKSGIKHLLIDLPSVDKEIDGGALSSHKAFWLFPGQARLDCTITEMIFVPDLIKDGLYLLNLQITSFDLDASPSKPVLYSLLQVNDME